MKSLSTIPLLTYLPILQNAHSQVERVVFTSLDTYSPRLFDTSIRTRTIYK